MKYFSWAQLGENIIEAVFRVSDRQAARDVFATHRDVLGRAYGLKRSHAEEVGVHAICDLVRKHTGKMIDLARGKDDEPLGWSFA